MFEQTTISSINNKESLYMICPGRRPADACGRIRVRSECVFSHQERGRRGNTHKKGPLDCSSKHFPQKRILCHHVLYSPSCSFKPMTFFLHQGHQVDYRTLIHDAVRGAANDSILPCRDFSVGQLYVSFRFKAS